MSVLLEDPTLDEPRPSLPGIHSLFSISKEESETAGSYPGGLSSSSTTPTGGRPGSSGQGSRAADMLESFSLSSESGSSRMGSLSSIASKESPTGGAGLQLQQPSGPPAVPPAGWHASRPSFSHQGIDPLSAAPTPPIQQSMAPPPDRRSSDGYGGVTNSSAQGGGAAVGGASGGAPFAWTSSPARKDGFPPSALGSTQHPSTAHYGHPAQPTQQAPPPHPQHPHQPVYAPSSAYGPRSLSVSDPPSATFAPPTSTQRQTSSLSGPSGRMQSFASSSTAVMRPPSPLRPYSAPWGGGQSDGSLAGFVRGEGGGQGAGQNVVFYDDADPAIDPSRPRTFQGGPVRRGSEVSSQGGSRRGSMVDPRGAGPDRSSTFVNHPSSAHPYHPYPQQPNANHHLQQPHYQPTPMSAAGQPLFHPHPTFMPVQQPQQPGAVQSLPFPQQPPFPANPNYAPNYANQQGGYYVPSQPHPHQQHPQHQVHPHPHAHPRLQQPLLHSQPTAPAPHLQNPHHQNDWQRRNSLPTNSSHHAQRMQMMPPPPVPPVWQREGAHQQHVFAGTAAGAAAAGAAGVEAMRRASDGDLLTGPSGGKEAKYDCPFCGKKFNRPSSLKIHTYSHTGEKPFSCSHPQCGRKFSVQSNLKRHSRTHSTASNSQQSHVSSDPSRPSSSTSSTGLGAGGGGGGGYDQDVDAEGEEDEL